MSQCCPDFSVILLPLPLPLGWLSSALPRGSWEPAFGLILLTGGTKIPQTPQDQVLSMKKFICPRGKDGREKRESLEMEGEGEGKGREQRWGRVFVLEGQRFASGYRGDRYST